MRVIAGSARGMNLYSDPSLTARPLTDRIKESLFGMLDAELPGSRILDLFAGIGTFGIEALSRGAEKAVFVEAEKKAAECIRKNLEKGRFPEKGDVVCDRAERFLATAAGEDYDLVFADPPFKSFAAVFGPMAEVIRKKNLVRKGGRLITRHHFKEPCEPEGYERTREKRYGENTVVFLAPLP